ncbi:uncharacterized protein LOC129913925 isoform X2 [Episyrphus balteatus]|uniref:uncharacterized protein LOC129913925 isoform X2 n=1 Tax=Episyrphus balteatus TaxID=286459 RepID=UPI002486C0B5|nr:uncharacterized protein LOC129913925 isoform X2 [Episyrphus balteatus]
MSEKVEQHQQQQQHMNNNNQRIHKSPEYQMSGMMPGGITRERSFVRTSNHQNINKRRSLAFNVQTGMQPNQMRTKPGMDIYRPPKLNYNLQHSSSSSMVFPAPGGGNLLAQQKSSASIHQQMQMAAAAAVMAGRRHAGLSVGSMPSKGIHPGQRTILVTHPMQLNNMGGMSVPLPSSQHPLVNSPSSGNIFHTTGGSQRVKFAAEPQKMHNSSGQMKPNPHMNNNGQYLNNNNNSHINGGDAYAQLLSSNPLQRSKSLSSADALTRGIAGLGLALGNEVTDIGQFPPDIQSLIDTALEDPNQLNSRCLMELTSHFIKRAVEGRRYALPISRLCLTIIAKEQKETFLEALLNTCRHWYQEREKLLYTIQGMKSPSRVRFTAFMAFLTEMFCQLKRRQLQLRTQCDGAPPPLVLLTLLAKCCEDCVTPPVRSLSEIECLFFVLTCIGRDLEQQLPQQLEVLLSLVRDAFLNASDSAPAIRRTLLQLIELQASHWQLPGNTVLYYYPSSK